jgi:hypothetical protein
MRAHSRSMLESIEFMNNSDDVVFNSQVLLQSVEQGFRMGEISVPVRYFRVAFSIHFSRSLRYGIGTVGTVLNYPARKVF